MDSYRRKQFPDFIDRPTYQEIAALSASVRAILGVDGLNTLHPVHVRLIETNIYRRLQETGDDHRRITDDEIDGWIESAEICFPRAFFVVAAAVGRPTCSTGFSLADSAIIRADRECIPRSLAIATAAINPETGHA